MSTFGALVKDARTRVGLTQAQLAHELDVQQQAVNRWESDKDQPKAEKVRHLTELLRLEPVEVCVSLGYIDRRAVEMPTPRPAREALEEDPDLSDPLRTVVLAAYDAAVLTARPARKLAVAKSGERTDAAKASALARAERRKQTGKEKP